jgi:hypothetical protein
VHGIVSGANHSIVFCANAWKEHLRVAELARNLGVRVDADEKSFVAVPQVFTLEDSELEH